MSDFTESPISRRKLLEAAGTAAVAAAAASLAGPSAAQPKAEDLVPFKLTITAPFVPSFAVPGNPPRVAVQQTYTGQAELLGAFTWVDHHIAYLGVDGGPKAVFGEMAFTGSSGDALYLIWLGVVRAPGVSEDAFFVTGGSGRFAGATGSGTLITARVPDKQELTWTFDGLISRPEA